MAGQGSYKVELNKVLQRMQIKNVAKNLKTLGFAQNHGYGKEVLWTIIQKVRADADLAAFEEAYKEAAEQQRIQDRNQIDMVKVYEDAVTCPPPVTVRSHKAGAQKAYDDFLRTRPQVVNSLAPEKDQAIVAYVDAGDNAKRLADYLGGLTCTKVDRKRCASNEPIDQKFTNIILYGHVTYLPQLGGPGGQKQPDLTKPRLGKTELLAPDELARFLGNRVQVSVVGCESDLFAEQLVREFRELGCTLAAVVQTKKPFQWVNPKNNAPWFVHAYDEEVKESYGTLSDILG